MTHIVSTDVKIDCFNSSTKARVSVLCMADDGTLEARQTRMDAKDVFNKFFYDVALTVAQTGTLLNEDGARLIWPDMQSIAGATGYAS